MSLAHEYMHHRTGYGLGSGAFWIRLYKGAAGDAPVVVCQELLPGAPAEVAGFLAAEVIREHFRDDLPGLPRPLLWIEHRPARRRGPGRYFLHAFDAYEPRPVGAGFVRRVTIGASRRIPLESSEVEALTRQV